MQPDRRGARICIYLGSGAGRQACGETMSVETEKVDLESPDLAAAKRAAFEGLFPGVRADGGVAATGLGALLDSEVTAPTDGRERFGLMWAGKHEAVRSLLTPS